VAQKDFSNLRVAEASKRIGAQLEAARAEKRRNAQLREAVFRVSNAAEDWPTAAANRADDWARTPPELLTGEHQAILGALLVAQKAAKNALALMDGSMRQVAPENATGSFPSTLGMPKAERNEVLNRQAVRLEDAGLSLEMIAYVMGWNNGTTEQTKDRTRNRLEEARERSRGRSRLAGSRATASRSEI
jgi:hypothetical protein